jgi:hypothetical protein
MDASTSAFLATGRKVDGPCLNAPIPPYHPPVPDPDGRLAQAQLAGAQLLSNALVRSFLCHTAPLDSLTTLPPCIVHWCQETDQPFQNLALVSPRSLTLTSEWAYDRTISRLLCDHAYVRTLPFDPFDPQRLVRYLGTTRWNDQRNLARHRSETLRHDQSQDDPYAEDAPYDFLAETCAAPLPWTQRVRLFHDMLTDMCDLLHVCRTTGDILLRYYLYGDTEDDIKRSYGISIAAVRKRLTRAIQQNPTRGAHAKAVFQDYLTAMQCTEDMSPPKRTRSEAVEADADDGMLEPETAGWHGRDFPGCQTYAH